MTKGSMPAGLASAARAAESRLAPSEGRLETIRSVLRHARDTELNIASLEERLREERGVLLELQHETLPSLFQEVGIDRLGLEPEDNTPGYDCALSDYYKAAISATWPQDRQDAGFDYLEEVGSGDLVKHQFAVLLPQGSEELARKLDKALQKLGVEYEQRRAVSWNTLTSWLKEQCLAGTVPELEKIGATVGKIVKLKQRKV